MEEARSSDRELSIEPRASDRQIQVEQVNLALQQLKQTQESLHGLESRLAEMTGECASILDRWAKNDEKHATAVVELHSRLSEWNDIERRLLNESASRIHQFERSLQHEWNALRQSHEEPLRQIDAQTTRVTEACLNAVDEALRGFERAESRLATLEQDFYREMNTLAREVRDAIAELRLAAPQLGPRQPWSLDNVVRLHNELRAEGELAAAGAPALAGVGAGLGVAVAPSARGTLAFADPLSVEQPAAAPRSQTPGDRPAPFEHIDTPPPSVPLWRRPAAWMAVLMVALAAFAAYLQSEMRAGLREATARADAAQRGATETQTRAQQQIEAVKQDSDNRLRVAQDAARAAQALASILAAPDLRRIDLVGVASTATAQALWSRTQGLAFSAARLPELPSGKVYQLWLFAPDRATSITTFTPSAAGGFSAQFAAQADLPRPIVRAGVTIEPAGGSPAPTGGLTLTSAPSASTPTP
jgi:hypothetical protein